MPLPTNNAQSLKKQRKLQLKIDEMNEKKKIGSAQSGRQVANNKMTM